ncbi:MAG: transposase [Mariprofundaceae bacterium]|nr:transposase [Mariprofundaceae bacterium]
MSRKSRVYSASFKSKLVLEVLKNEQPLSEIAMEPSKAVKECERIYLNEYASIAELQEDVDDYIDFYNHRRFHETLEYKKPMNTYHESIESQQPLKKAA